MINLDDFPQHVAWCRKIVEQMNPTERTPDSLRKKISDQKLPGMNGKLAEEIARHLEEQYEVQQAFGSSIASETYKPWLQSKKADIDFYFWRRFSQYLIEEKCFPPAVTRNLDDTTGEILDYAGDPLLEGSFQRRGMVVGHVQSGKTSNYSSLICKAADAGYKVIILLSGLTNSLRRQTQDRIDHAFIGQKAVFQRGINRQLIGAAKYATRKRFPFWGTTIDQDFSLKAAQNFGVPIQNLSEPIIFVTKKNPSTLNNLLEWLRMFYPNGGIEHPLLLIDDEADNASVNTQAHKGEITTINQRIRAILKQFQKASYIAYTATPFANIFISPETNEEMLGDDLFPRDFIKILDVPSNYVGPSRVFREDGDLAETMVRKPDDYQDILPVKHKNHMPVEALPQSLIDAVQLFVLARTIRVIHGKGHAHCSMMVNVSRFNSVQGEVSDLLWEFLREISDEIRLYSKAASGLQKSTLLQSLRISYISEYQKKDEENELPSWDNIQTHLTEAVSTIFVKVVNMKGGGLEYDKYERTGGMHVIAVGGLALSRGLTLEGLCVSYILRNPSAYDTLMQMGRWFGYHLGYERICRLYIPDFARDYYEYITDAIEELSQEVTNMEYLGMTPKQFGLKVREHPAAIRITAANKMSGATRINVGVSYANKHLEGHALFNSEEINQQNRQLIGVFCAQLGSPIEPEDVKAPQLFWQDVPKSKIVEFISRFRLPRNCNELYIKPNKSSLALEYINDRSSELQSWDVAVVESSTSTSSDSSLIGSKSFFKRRRKSGALMNGGRIFQVTGAKQRVADKNDAAFGLTLQQVKAVSRPSDWAFNSKRSRPLLLIHSFDAGLKRGSEALLTSFVSYSICFPGTKTTSPERQYQANEVWTQRNLFDEFDDDDTDEDAEMMYE